MRPDYSLGKQGEYRQEGGCRANLLDVDLRVLQIEQGRPQNVSEM